jgi:hypothetical protein
VLLTSLSPATRAKDEKLKPEELIAKHLDSIGTAEKRKAVTSRSTGGAMQVSFRVGGSGTLNGKANILSQGNLVRAGFAFQALEYPGEQIAFDGTKVTAGQISPGNYPPFAGFLYEHDSPIKEGLMFGTLSTSWPLLDVATRQPKLDISGLKKIDGRQLYEVKYSGKNLKGGMQAWLYFDPETFRHVRTQFKLEVPSTKMDKIADSAELVRYSILEQFDDFKQVDGLTLPHSYKLEFTVDGPRGGLLTTWSNTIERIAHNEIIEKKLFSMQ